MKMEHKLHYKLVIVACLIVLLSAVHVQIVSAVPYHNYTYDSNQSVVSSPAAYLPAEDFGGADLGVGNLSSPQDITADADYLYLLDTGNNRILVIDSNWQVVRIISQFENNGLIDSFNQPQGIDASADGKLYIADTRNARIVVMTREGEFISEIGQPSVEDDQTFGEGFVYRPIKVVVDPLGRIYVIARDVFEGLLSFYSDGQFFGFMGSPRVTPTLADIIWHRLYTDEQRSRSSLFIPTEYMNLDIDNDGLILAVEQDQVRRLNPAGANILIERGLHPVEGDHSIDVRNRFSAIVGRDFGGYSILDRENGRIFTYDANGNLLYIFGGSGLLFGTFQDPIALTDFNNQLVVLDGQTNRFTVFKPTAYANLIHQAIHQYESGQYLESMDTWLDVLQMNSNYDLAYSSISRTLIREEQYAEALTYARAGDDRINYSDAFQRYRKEVVEANFGLIFVVVILIVLAFRFFKRSKLGVSLNRKFQAVFIETMLDSDGDFAKTSWLDGLIFSLHVIWHPFDGFWRIKHERKGNLYSAITILVLVTFSYLFMLQYTGFVLNPRDLTQINFLVEILTIIVPFVLWVGVNWALTTLMNGKGSLKEIFVASAYALTPLIIILIPMTIISNFLVLEEQTFYTMFTVLGLVWTLVLVFVAMMETHEYTTGKAVATAGLTVAGMGFLLFIGLLFVTLFDEAVAFINSIYLEIVVRL